MCWKYMLNNKNRNLTTHTADYLIRQQLLREVNVDSKAEIEWPHQAQETGYFQQRKKLCRDLWSWNELGTCRKEMDMRVTLKHKRSTLHELLHKASTRPCRIPHTQVILRYYLFWVDVDGVGVWSNKRPLNSSNQKKTIHLKLLKQCRVQSWTH